MARDIVHAEIARQREAELRRRSELHLARSASPGPGAQRREAVTIRLAAAHDGRELDLLTRRKGAQLPVGPRLIAELGGRPVAAMSLVDRAVIADPDERTGDVVELLRLRAAQLLGDARPRPLSLETIAKLSRAFMPRRSYPAR